MSAELAAAYSGLRLQNQVRATQLGLQLLWLVMVGLAFIAVDLRTWQAYPQLHVGLALGSMALTGLFSLNDLRAVYHLTALQAAVGHRSVDIATAYQRWLNNVNAVQGFYFALYVVALGFAFSWSHSVWVLTLGVLWLGLLLAVTLAMTMHLISLRNHFVPRPLAAASHP